MPGAVADAAPTSASTRPATGSPDPLRRRRPPGREAPFRHGPAAGCAARPCTPRCATPSTRPGVQGRAAAGARSVEHRDDHVLVDGEPARYLVAADGLHSPVRRLLGLEAPRRAAPPLRAARPRRHGAVDAVRRGALGRAVAEAYVTPVGRRPGRRRGAQPTSARPFDDLLAELPAAGRAAGRAARWQRVRGAGPLRQRSRRRVAGRVLLVGDAAGYVDALTGEGIALGLAQARAAVDAVAAGDPARYERAWRRLGRRHDLLTQALLAATRRAGRAPPARAGGGRGCRGSSPPPSTSSRGRHEPAPTGRARGAARRGRAGRSAPRPRPSVHHADTPLHLAFSCYVFDADGRLLLTQRAWHKATWPGRVDQQRAAATRRPASRSPTPYADGSSRSSGSRSTTCGWCCPAFRYRAVMADGIVENEMCPVFVAAHRRTPSRPTPPRSTTHAWVPWADFRADVLDGRARRQPVVRPAGRGAAGRPVAAPAADPDLLPPAARGIEVRAGLELRPATEDDVAFLSDLVIDVTRDQGRFPADADEAEYRAGFAEWTREQVAGELPGSTTYVLLPRATSGWAGSAWSRTDGGDRARRHPAAARTCRGAAWARRSSGPSRRRVGPSRSGSSGTTPSARALYERLGFALVGHDDRDDLLRWAPDSGMPGVPGTE